MAKKTAAQPAPAGVSQTIAQLLETCKLDTLYRDLYLQRARELMDTVLPRSTYIQMKENLASLGMVERQLKAAVERGDWGRSKELTERVRTLRGSAAAMKEQMLLSEAVYEGAADIHIDPFSKGFHVFVGATAQKLGELHNHAIKTLTALQQSDPTNKDFYARRIADFRSLSVSATPEQAEKAPATAGAVDLQQEALNALEAGDMSRLDSAVDQLMKSSAEKEAKQEKVGAELAEVDELGEDLLYSFSEATLAAARDLGLAPARTKSRRHFAHLLPHGWRPSLMKDEIKEWSKDQLSRLTYPSGTSNEAREAIEFYLLTPFVTSGGTRFEVCLVEEDLLIEDFAEPEPKQELHATKLLQELGLESRRGLSRIDIENAVLMHGPRILKEKLALDPEQFRLVAIPPDIFTSFAGERGWGQREMWTHFDGYRIREGGKLAALAGGDKRFGGTHDVVSFSPTYSRETIIARFAVVQRKRMMSWHKN